MVAPLLSFVLLQTHHPPKSFCFTGHNSKAGAPVSVPHTPHHPIYFVAPPKTLHITTPHTGFSPQYAHVLRDFTTRPRRHRIFRPDFSPPTTIPPPDLHHRRPTAPADRIKLRSILNKISKIESPGRQINKRDCCCRPCRSLSKHIGTVKSAATHRKRSKQSHTTNAAT